MPIIDAQVHLWRKGTPTPLHLATPYLVEDAIRGMDEAGVDGAILHPPASWDPDSNEQAVEAALAYPKRFAILGFPPLDKPDSRSLIATWKQRRACWACGFISTNCTTGPGRWTARLIGFGQ